MTYEEPTQIPETAMGAALEAAGIGSARKRAHAIEMASLGQPLKRMKLFQADRQAWFAHCRMRDEELMAERAESPKRNASTVADVPAQTRRNLSAVKAAGKAAGKERKLEIGSIVVQRFVLDFGEVHLRESTPYFRLAYVLRRLKEMYPDHPADMQIKDVRRDVLGRLIDEASDAVAA